jgi:hypothetical protein
MSVCVFVILVCYMVLVWRLHGVNQIFLWCQHWGILFFVDYCAHIDYHTGNTLYTSLSDACLNVSMLVEERWAGVGDRGEGGGAKGGKGGRRCEN